VLDRAPGDVIMANATRSEKLDLRLTPEAKRVLNAAAQASRRSVSEFVLEGVSGRARCAAPAPAAAPAAVDRTQRVRASADRIDDVPHREAAARSSRRGVRLRQGTVEPLPDPLCPAKPAFQQLADLSGFLEGRGCRLLHVGVRGREL